MQINNIIWSSVWMTALSRWAAKQLAAQRDRPFAEFTLSGSEGLRVTVEGPISSSRLKS